MAHQIESNDRNIFVKQPAWHGLGTTLPESVSVDEALKMTLDWEPELVPVIRSDTGETLASHSALVRSDDRTLLSIKTDQYNVFKNSTVAKATKIAFPNGRIETAGSLRGGKQVWFLVRLPESDFDARRNDPVNAYGLVTSSHDGTIQLTGLPTGVRVVCANTMSMALAGGRKPISVRHKGAAMASEDAVLSLVYRQAEVVKNGLAHMRDGSQTLAKVAPTKEWLDKFFLAVAEEVMGKQVMAMTAEEVTETKNLVSTFTVNLDHPNVKVGETTKWTAFNAVTQWSVHNRRTRGDRGVNNWLGSGAAVTKHAFDTALALV